MAIKDNRFNRAAYSTRLVTYFARNALSGEGIRFQWAAYSTRLVTCYDPGKKHGKLWKVSIGPRIPRGCDKKKPGNNNGY